MLYKVVAMPFFEEDQTVLGHIEAENYDEARRIVASVRKTNIIISVNEIKPMSVETLHKLIGLYEQIRHS